ncbi:unnamed protein product [Linum trigynum]|uniref:Uncharacterized protein n=1 Tax=Linum trigynum TaxID=586398 RepID=A0AAV2CBW3_9ROSI
MVTTLRGDTAPFPWFAGLVNAGSKRRCSVFMVRLWTHRCQGARLSCWWRCRASSVLAHPILMLLAQSRFAISSAPDPHVASPLLTRPTLMAAGLECFLGAARSESHAQQMDSNS